MEFWERRTFADWERNRIADFSLMSTFMNPYAPSTFLFQQRKMLSRSAFQKNGWGLQLVFGSLCPNECTLSVLIILMQRGWFTFLVVAVRGGNFSKLQYACTLLQDSTNNDELKKCYISIFLSCLLCCKEKYF